MSLPKSSAAFRRAQRVLPGGVDSPVRAFGAVGGAPRFITHGKGARLWDADGHDYIDYVGSWGVAILGHAHPNIVAVLKHAVEQGTSFGMPTELEVELAEMICQAVPSVEMLRFVNSGTEATMSAIRLARGFTGRSRIIKFEGCYHGHADGLLVKAGSGLATFGEPTSAGVSQATAEETIVLPYNDIDRVAEAFTTMGDDIAAVIVEPIAGNMGCVLPREGFLQGLCDITRAHNALLIFDEVITGFRVGFGGAQSLSSISPDLTCFGKIIGGGLPVGAYGGRREIMEKIAPLGPVYQAGTLSGNPLAMSAGIETLKLLQKSGIYDDLKHRTERFTKDLGAALAEHRIPHHINSVGSMWTLFFTKTPVTDFATASQIDTARFRRFFHAMLEAGIALPPSPFETAFVSLAHTDEDLKATVSAVWEWAKRE